MKQMQKNKTIAICGAGIAGVATAYYLLKKSSDHKVVIIDKNQPLSFTTSKSGENFRDYWPQECMQQFMGHSIDLMNELREQYGYDSFDMRYSGYNFISHNKEEPIFGIDNQEGSKKYIEETTATETIEKEHPYLDKSVEKIVTIKKAGNIDVYALGSLLLREAKKRGLKQIEGEITGIAKEGASFKVALDSKKTIDADQVVIAAGPFINHIANMLGFQFPISNTLQRKIVVPDPKNVIPDNMPFTIYADSQYLDWSKEEKAFFASEKKYEWLMEKFPGGLHIKPEGEGIKLGWAFQTKKVAPAWETPGFDFFPQVVLKGASLFIPKLLEYENSIPAPVIEYAGYYTRTKENWPLIGPSKMQNVFVVGALAGYGTMGACAAGELCSSHVLNETELPAYTAYFHPGRYQNQDMTEKINELKNDGQL